jgi:hypothetical protein
MAANVGSYGHVEFFDMAKYASLQPVLSQFPKELFDPI